MTVAVFPGSFDPLTVAHVAIADAVRSNCAVERVDLVISRQAMEKQARAHTSVEARVATIDEHRMRRPWLRSVVTEEQLLVDIAVGYDILVLGADKWHQVHDPRFYGDSEEARDTAIRRLPGLAIVRRAGSRLPASVHDSVLDVPTEFRDVSSTAVRGGRVEWRAVPGPAI